MRQGKWLQDKRVNFKNLDISAHHTIE